MGSFKVEQRRLVHRGREFHFVSYDGEPAKPARQQEASAPTWFLMNAGKRWTVMPHTPGQELDELDRALTTWLDKNVFS